MAKSIVTVLQGKTFKTKGILTEYVKSILHKYDLWDSLNAEDESFMLEFFEAHPCWYEKQGCGVKRVFIGQDQVFKSKGFWLEWLDGGKTDISYKQCLNPSGAYAHFASAARQAISWQILEFRDNYFKKNINVICPFTNESLTANSCHVDHIPPFTFSNLLNDFIKKNDIKIEEVETLSIQGQAGRIFADGKLYSKWELYHLENARLRIVSKHANLTIIPKIARQEAA